MSSPCPSTWGPSRPHCNVASTVPVLMDTEFASRLSRPRSRRRPRLDVFPVSIDLGTKSATLQRGQHGPRADGHRIRVEAVSTAITAPTPIGCLPRVHRLGDHSATLQVASTVPVLMDTEFASRLSRPRSRRRPRLDVFPVSIDLGTIRPHCNVASTVPVLMDAGCASRGSRPRSRRRPRLDVFPVSIDLGTKSATLQVASTVPVLMDAGLASRLIRTRSPSAALPVSIDSGTVRLL